MTDTTAMVDFLLARIAEDEAKIAAMMRERTRAQTAPVFASHPPGWLDGVDIFVSPDRWRAECDTKRRLLAGPLAAAVHGRTHHWRAIVSPETRAEAMVGEWALRLMLAPYCGHADYRSEWDLIPPANPEAHIPYGLSARGPDGATS